MPVALATPTTRQRSAPAAFVRSWRDQAYRAFDLFENSTAKAVKRIDLWGRPARVYANANLSIYSAQVCTGDCPFCVEQLRPLARGWTLEEQRQIEQDDAVYFAALLETLEQLEPLSPSVSITGGEPSLDPRLPRILRLLKAKGARKRTLTTNGSGLLLAREGKRVIDWIVRTGVKHLNVSRALQGDAENAAVMGLGAEALTKEDLRHVVRRAREGGTRVRLSCVLTDRTVGTLEQMIDYLEFAREVGVDNVVFRQLMLAQARQADRIAEWSDRHRVLLQPLLERVSADTMFRFVKQVVGYYYYVEVWRYREIDVVFESADLSQLERVRRQRPELIHELVFHPNARLGKTWQMVDPPLGPKSASRIH